MSTTLTIRVDKQDKQQAEKILNNLGLTLSAGINVFLKALIRKNGLPFSLTNEKFSYEDVLKMLKNSSSKK